MPGPLEICIGRPQFHGSIHQAHVSEGMLLMIEVTDCRVYLNQNQDDHLKGFASIILNEELAICDLKIIQGNAKLFVAMPSRRRRDGTFHDVAHPIVHNLREHIENIVLETYHREVTEGSSGEILVKSSEPSSF
jgi:stage V sporulation protein G